MPAGLVRAASRTPAPLPNQVLFMPDTSKPHAPAADQLPRLIGGAILLVMLDYGKDVLIPIVLAVFLALLLAPLIRRLRQWGLGQTQAVAISVFLLFVSVSAATAVLGSQALRLASSLPQYELTIRDKLQSLNRLTLGKLDAIVNQADQLVGKLSPSDTGSAQRPAGGVQPPLRVQIDEPHAKPFEIVSSVLKAVVPPLEMGGIVFIVLIFILLDYESLRDRAIRLVGGGNLRATTRAITDATERLSRFFVSQFAVNALVGTLIAAGVGLAGLSGALFWGALTAVLRFVPYVGIWLAAGAATIMAAAMSDGWTLMIQTALVFLLVEIVIAQFLEPKIYGHSAGLSPVSVLVSAIFWSAIWGPVGLILATPLTLCLVVAGRHVRALNFLEVLLGDMSALNQAERFYQRALSGDSTELVHGLRKFLRDRSLAEYGDQVILASIRLAYVDFSEHEITENEHERMQISIFALTDAMARMGSLGKRRALRSPLASGQPDSPRPTSGVAKRSVLVAHLDDEVADLLARIMLEVLRREDIKARPLDYQQLAGGGQSEDIALVIVVCSAPQDHAQALGEMLDELRRRLPAARRVVMRALDDVTSPFARPTAAECGADALVGSYHETVDITCRLLAE